MLRQIERRAESQSRWRTSAVTRCFVCVTAAVNRPAAGLLLSLPRPCGRPRRTRCCGWRRRCRRPTPRLVATLGRLMER